MVLQVGHIMAAFLPQPGVQQTKLLLYILELRLLS